MLQENILFPGVVNLMGLCWMVSTSELCEASHSASVRRDYDKPLNYHVAWPSWPLVRMKTKPNRSMSLRHRMETGTRQYKGFMNICSYLFRYSANDKEKAEENENADIK